MFFLTRTATSMQCIFSASLEMVDRVLVEARKFMAPWQGNIDDFEFRLILREALNNAVIHGNGRDETLQVALTIQCDGRKLKITISDQGPGFAWQQRLKKVRANPDQPGGRGLILIQSAGYSLSFNKLGNTLILKKILG